MAHTFFPTVRSVSLQLGLLLGVSAAAMAQTGELHVKVPFAFQNGTQRLPAGDYEIDLRRDHLLAFRGEAQTKALSYAVTIPEQMTEMPETSKVVFHRLHGVYFLHSIVVEGDKTARSWPKSRAEKQLQIADRWAQPSSDVVALNTLP